MTATTFCVPVPALVAGQHIVYGGSDFRVAEVVPAAVLGGHVVLAYPVDRGGGTVTVIGNYKVHPGDPLSAQEIRILAGVAAGHTNDAIAARLHLSVDTVKTYMKVLCRKLNARNRAHAAVLGVALGYLTLPQLTGADVARKAKAVAL